MHIKVRAGYDKKARAVLADVKQLVRAGRATVFSLHDDIEVVGDAGRRPFDHVAAAPTRSAPQTTWSSSNVLTTATCVAEARRVTSPVAARPSMRGMRLSINATSAPGRPRRLRVGRADGHESGADRRVVQQRTDRIRRQDRHIANDLDHDPLRGPPVTFCQHAESKAAARMRQTHLPEAEVVLDNTVCGTNDRTYEWTPDRILPYGARLTVWVTRDGGRTSVAQYVRRRGREDPHMNRDARLPRP